MCHKRAMLGLARCTGIPVPHRWREGGKSISSFHSTALTACTSPKVVEMYVSRCCTVPSAAWTVVRCMCCAASVVASISAAPSALVFSSCCST